MEVLSFPAALGAKDNPYLSILGDALRDQGVVIRPYRQLGRNGPADVLHMHWPERLVANGPARHHPIFGLLSFQAMIRTAQHIRRKGGRFIWTCHNLAPHEQLGGGRDWIWRRYFDRLIAEVDGVICMSPDVVDKVDATLPALSRAARYVIRHPHYRDFYREWHPPAQLMRQLGLETDKRLVSMVGYIRPYKGIEDAMSLFAAVARPNEVLLIAGHCKDPSYAAALDLLASGLSAQIIVRVGALSDTELATIYKASDVALFNFRNILNSGSVITALSLDVPVISPAMGSIVDLHHQVGAWCRLFDAPLTPGMLRILLDQPRPAGRPDLSSFDPAKVAREHMAAFRSGVPAAL